MAMEHENQRLAYGSALWWRREFEDMVDLRNRAERERDEAREVTRYFEVLLRLNGITQQNVRRADAPWVWEVPPDEG